MQQLVWIQNMFSKHGAVCGSSSKVLPAPYYDGTLVHYAVSCA